MTTPINTILADLGAKVAAAAPLMQPGEPFGAAPGIERLEAEASTLRRFRWLPQGDLLVTHAYGGGAREVSQTAVLEVAYPGRQNDAELLTWIESDMGVLVDALQTTGLVWPVPLNIEVVEGAGRILDLSGEGRNLLKLSLPFRLTYDETAG